MPRYDQWRRLSGDTDRPDLLDAGKKLLGYLAEQRRLSGVQTVAAQRVLPDGSVLRARFDGNQPSVEIQAPRGGRPPYLDRFSPRLFFFFSNKVERLFAVDVGDYVAAGPSVDRARVSLLKPRYESAGTAELNAYLVAASRDGRYYRPGVPHATCYFAMTDVGTTSINKLAIVDNAVVGSVSSPGLDYGDMVANPRHGQVYSTAGEASGGTSALRVFSMADLSGPVVVDGLPADASFGVTTVPQGDILLVSVFPYLNTPGNYTAVVNTENLAAQQVLPAGFLSGLVHSADGRHAYRLESLRNAELVWYAVIVTRYAVSRSLGGDVVYEVEYAQTLVDEYLSLSALFISPDGKHLVISRLAFFNDFRYVYIGVFNADDLALRHKGFVVEGADRRYGPVCFTPDSKAIIYYSDGIGFSVGHVPAQPFTKLHSYDIETAVMTGVYDFAAADGYFNVGPAVATVATPRQPA